MSAEPLADLRARVERALSESVTHVDRPARPDEARNQVHFHFARDRCWALADIESTRYLLTDPAARALGGGNLSVTVDDLGVTIHAVEAPRGEETVHR